jgi:hypothetical protein
MNRIFALALVFFVLNAQTLISPYPSAPACEVHDNLTYHGLWNETLGCHYDHEHGDNPSQIASLFGVNYTAYTITNLSYPWQTEGENINKHGGYKWTVRATNEDPCIPGEYGINGTDGFAVQFHGKGDAHEFEHRVHSDFIIVRVCDGTNSGILVTGGWQDYGQHESPYQGVILNLPDQPVPAFPSALSPYNTLHCFNDDGLSTDCGTKASTTSPTTWVSRPQAALFGNVLTQLLWRSRDTYQIVNGSTRLTMPTYRYVCGNTIYNPIGCKANSTTGTIHQIWGEIPAEWDMLDGVPDGLVTYSGYTDRWGNLVFGCETGLDCIPLVLQGIPIGGFSTTFDNQVNAFTPAALPDRDICFKTSKNGTVVQVGCDTSGAIPSGWIGSGN